MKMSSRCKIKPQKITYVIGIMTLETHSIT
jgi:hypothetical protein